MRAALFLVSLAAVAGLAACTNDAAPADTTEAPPEPSQVTTSPSVTQLPNASSAQPPAKPPSGQPSAPVTLSPSGELVVPAGVEQVPAAQIDASALPVYYEHHGDVWVFDDGYSLEMFAAASSGCTDAEAVVVDQSADDIRITLRPLPSPPGGRPDGGGACTAVMTPRPVTVGLDQPLGGRTIFLGIGR